jgi:hypothetical protein
LLVVSGDESFVSKSTQAKASPHFKHLFRKRLRPPAALSFSSLITSQISSPAPLTRNHETSLLIR